MKKLFLFALLFTATTLFAEEKVETFDTKDGTATNTYVTTVTTKECQQASWTFFSGGILKNLGNMGSTNFAAVIRAKKSTETVYPYMESSAIDGGVDSLWFTWNSNGNETGGTWNVAIYINGDSVGAITGAGGPKADAPFYKYGIGNLGISGEFTIKLVNLSPYSGTGNSMRFVFDDLSWTSYGSAPVKQKPTFEFAEDLVVKVIGAERFTNPLTNTSDATPVFKSSDPYTARVDQTGEITITKLGTAVITATVEETETYKAATASYTVRVVPENFNMETFDGASNITSGTSYYITKDSVCPPSTATGIVWTTYLGSVRNTMGSWPAANIAACIRAKKSAEPKFGYLKSDLIKGGIDSLAFDWNTNGDESTRQQNWNIVIYINGDSVGAITDKPAAKQAAGNEFRYTLGNLKIDGDFVIEFVNKDTAEADANQFRWTMDNLEWYSYEAPCEPSFGIMVDGKDYIPGNRNEAQPDYMEYMIVAELEANQSFVFYDKCAKAAFMAKQEDKTGNYVFNYNADTTAFVAPHKGTYTIYLKMYGVDNNWIWTEYEYPKYVVTIAEPLNGTLVVMDGLNEVKNGDKVQVNKILTIIPTPAEGYQIASVTTNGDEVTPQEGGYYYMMSYIDVTIAATFVEKCEEQFGIMVNGMDYIAGVKNEAQTEWLEYKIDADLEANDTFLFYDMCTEIGFMAKQDEHEGNYLFNYTEGNTAFLVPVNGKYTIYLKMYGPDNNVIWTECQETTGIENNTIKVDVRKAIENGVVVIYRNGIRYNLQGQTL